MKSKQYQLDAPLPAAVESPVLHLDTGSYRTRGAEWVCCSRLDDLFDLEGADKICFVAKRRPDRYTYRTQITKNAIFLIKPIESVLYFPMSRWLKKQIAAGRPHIGVRIIK